jgi:hypothetical protein
MAFVQVIAFNTSKIDEMRKLDDEWGEKAGPESTARRGLLCEDRDNAGRYVQVVFFDSYEAAMKNSELPITREFAEKMGALADGPPTFSNLDVLEDRDWS